MFSLGLSLGLDEFRRVFEKPIAVACGLLGQLVLLPIVAVLLALLLGLPSFVAMGLIVLAACPGGATSNAFSVLARGDVALSISLTAITSVVAFLTVPLIINSGFALFATQGVEVSLPFGETAQRVALTTLLPVAVGMLVRSRREGGFPILQQTTFYLAFAALMVPSVGIIADNGSVMLDAVWAGAPAGALLNIVATAVGFGLALLFGLPATQQRTIALEVGIQNFGLVVVIILSFLADPRLMVVALFYLPSMLLVGGAMALIAARRTGPEEAPLRIYLDDERETPPGWVRAYWPDEAITRLEKGNVSEISLDHDLGDDERGTGYDVLLWIEEAVATRGFRPPKMQVHSANSSARDKMELAIKSIERLAEKNG